MGKRKKRINKKYASKRGGGGGVDDCSRHRVGWLRGWSFSQWGAIGVTTRTPRSVTRHGVFPFFSGVVFS